MSKKIDDRDVLFTVLKNISSECPSGNADAVLLRGKESAFVSVLLLWSDTMTMKTHKKEILHWELPKILEV